MVHEGAPCSCNECEYKAAVKTHLTRHTKLIHQDQQYPCEQCDYETKRKGTLGKIYPVTSSISD